MSYDGIYEPEKKVFLGHYINLMECTLLERLSRQVTRTFQVQEEGGDVSLSLVNLWVVLELVRLRGV